MSRLIMWNLVTLDGYFEGSAKWDLSFHDIVWGPELEQLGHEQLGDAEGLIFGRVTYEGMAAYWSAATGQAAEGKTAEQMNRIPKIVFSRTLERADWSNTRLVRGDAAEEVARLKREGRRDYYVFGSANLSASLMKADLFDEYRLCVVPVVLGAGIPLFKPLAEQKKLRIRESRPLKTGGVILYCVPA